MLKLVYKHVSEACGAILGGSTPLGGTKFMSPKLQSLESELKKYQEKLKHMTTEYSDTREGSAYGCEYYEIQCRVLQSMVIEIQQEILKTKKAEKLL